MKNKSFIVIMALVLGLALSGCGGNTAPDKEEVVDVDLSEKEQAATDLARDFLIATQGDKETIKKLSFSTMEKHLDETGWSIMLAPGISIDEDSFDFKVEQISDNQYFVYAKYKGELKKDGTTMPLNFSNKIGLIDMNDELAVFSFENEDEKSDE